MNNIFQLDAKIEILQALRNRARYVLLVGGPGSSKRFLAQWIHNQLPPLTARENEALRPMHGEILAPPFRAPHHTTSLVGMLGGGYPERPGEVSLATHGVLLLDEVEKFLRLDRVLRAIKRGEVPLRKLKGAEDRTRYPAIPRLVIGTTVETQHSTTRNILPWDVEINLEKGISNEC